MNQLPISNSGLAFITSWEGGAHLEIYPCSAGKPTIGVGHVCTPEEQKRFTNGITYDQAMELLAHDLSWVHAAIEKNVTRKLIQQELDATMALVFNTGEDQFRKSRTLKRLNDGNVDAMVREWKGFRMVRNADGKLEVSPGLVRRRAAELLMFTTGEYQDVDGNRIGGDA